MYKLYAFHGQDHIVVDFKKARSLSIKDILDQSKLRVRSACRGYGACGLCKIKLQDSKKINELSPSESMHLSEDEINDDVRLACQVFPDKDIEVEIINIAPKSIWRSATLAKHDSIYKELSYNEKSYQMIKEPLGVAIDVGTTNISITVFSLKTAFIISERLIFNPQNLYGTDVISRILASLESKKTAKKLHNLVIKIIGDGLKDIE
ncbi:2Fe-2S iron-sulfur cluster-binding protein, partial [Arcobacteraceae bacterium]|nr:2Fe-2S iron-sulfur cluster-binding protein [Arcobacteraceae bacterium]